MRIPSLLLAGWFCVLAGPSWAAGIFRYVEKDGTIIYTNVPPSGVKARKVGASFHSAPSKTVSATEAVPRAKLLTDYDGLIDSAAKRYRIPAHLVRAVMHVESSFDQTAVSPKGASGLMQLMPATAEGLYVKDLFDARDNIEGGTRYLRVLANQFEGDMVKMVAAYNAGPEAVRKYGGTVPPYPETQAYVRKVLALYYQYKKQSESAPVGN